jgi:hypothetical protein
MPRHAGISRTLGAGRVMASVAMVAALVALVFAGAPASAFNPVGSPARGWGSGGIAQQDPLSSVANCSAEYSGVVTADRGPGNGGEVSLDRFSFNCGSQATVTARSLPWTLTVDSSRGITVRGVVIDLTTAQGTCQYAGDLLHGFLDDSLGLTDIGGSMDRRTSGCGIGQRIGVSISGASTMQP